MGLMGKTRTQKKQAKRTFSPKINIFKVLKYSKDILNSNQKPSYR